MMNFIIFVFHKTSKKIIKKDEMMVLVACMGSEELLQYFRKPERKKTTYKTEA
jgi:hypothetical protein